MNTRVARKVIKFKVLKDGHVNISRYRRGTVERALAAYARHHRRLRKVTLEAVHAIMMANREMEDVR